jgi:uncharacterized membrane protein (UPF0127 family)
VDKKFAFQLLGLIILIFGALAATFIYRGQTPFSPTSGSIFSNPDNTVISEIKRLELKDGTSGDTKAAFNIEIVDEPEERSLGLGGRESLATGSGMLFIFDKSEKYRFWMKGMRFPLDFIWINDTRVVDILPEMKPPEPNQPDETLPFISPIIAVDKVLEVNSGDARRYNIRVGDKIEIKDQEQIQQQDEQYQYNPSYPPN